MYEFIKRLILQSGAESAFGKAVFRTDSLHWLTVSSVTRYISIIDQHIFSYCD